MNRKNRTWSVDQNVIERVAKTAVDYNVSQNDLVNQLLRHCFNQLDEGRLRLHLRPIKNLPVPQVKQKLPTGSS